MRRLLVAVLARRVFHRSALRSLDRGDERLRLLGGTSDLEQILPARLTQPGILDDGIPSERQWGIDAGLAWRRVADASVVYIDRGISKGMEYGILAAIEAGKPVEFRTLTA